MNLGSANLKSVNGELKPAYDIDLRILMSSTASRPQLLHSLSKQSIAASDDYFSFSDYASDASSINSRLTAIRYETPPSRTRSPNTSRDQLDSEMTLPARPARDRVNAVPAPLTVRFDESEASKHKAESSTTQDKNPGDNSPPTPGVDDTPYIRFAIDQLTRDEELTGRGRQGSVVSTDYPIERIIPDEGLGYYTTGAPRRDPPRQERPLSIRRERRLSPGKLDLDPAVEPNLTSQYQPDILIAVDPPNDHYRYPSLGFVPKVLRPLFLAVVVIVCLLMIAALIFCNIYSLRHNGLWDWNGVGGSRYFVFQFLPPLLAVLIILWLFVIQAAIYRVIPFSMMATERSLDKVLLNFSLLPQNFLLPDLSHFMHGEPLIGFCLFIIWLAIFSIPLQSCIFQARLITANGHGTWRWTSVQEVVWVLVALYVLLVVALLLLLFRFCRSWSGLMWDPVCLADLVPIFQKSNILPDFERSETSSSLRKQIRPKTLRLGYWTTTKAQDIFYGIGEENAPLRTYSLQRERLKEKAPADIKQEGIDVERQHGATTDSFERNIHSPFVRYRWTPWFLRDSSVVAWIVVALVLLIAWIVVSFVKQAVRLGFLPLLPSAANSQGFSSSNFLFSFIPSLIGTFLFLAWQPVDTYFRAVQPFANLTSPRGTSAEHSLLLAYPSCLPIEVTFLALMDRHFKVAWISLISLLSAAIPVISGGVFIAEFFVADQQVRIAAYMPAYYTLIAFVVLYALSFLIVWPRRIRYLPHNIRTLAELLSFFYQSPLLNDRVFREPRSKADLVTRLVTTPPGESGNAGGPKYAFGVYRGRDGKDHLGIDRLQRPGSGEMLITAGIMR